MTNSLGSYTFEGDDNFRCTETRSYEIHENITTGTNRTSLISTKARQFQLTGWLVDYDGSSPSTRKASIEALADAKQSLTLTCSDFVTDTPSVYIINFITSPIEGVQITTAIAFTLDLVGAV